MNKTVHVDELPFTPTEAPQDLKPRVSKPKASPPLAQEDPDTFDWNDPNEDSIVLREQRATAVYRNRLGEVIIRQRGPWPDEDSILYISPENEIAFMEGMAEQLKK
jgi:hypothetical protein